LKAEKRAVQEKQRCLVLNVVVYAANHLVQEVVGQTPLPLQVAKHKAKNFVAKMLNAGAQQLIQFAHHSIIHLPIKAFSPILFLRPGAV
jgi:Na+/citrate or Na+/malate symporter